MTPFTTPFTVRTAWCDAERWVCLYLDHSKSIVCRVVGWDNCFDDTLADINKGTSGVLDVQDTPVHQ